VTSQAGSADVLEALGIKIDMTPDQASASLRDHHFAFLFAPNYHPAFKQIGPVRRLCAERGQRTIFNFLGPLLNPARPTAQLVGVPGRELCVPIAAVLQTLGVRRGMVVCGAVVDGKTKRYLDEFSTLGDNYVAEFSPGASHFPTISPGGFPIQPATLADLAGADRQTNAGIVRRILHGEERGPRRDAVLLNAAAAMVVAGKCRTLLEGWQLASDLIESRKTERKLKELVAASAGLTG
jgi:anthranilate phosphoribosyltransferase